MAVQTTRASRWMIVVAVVLASLLPGASVGAQDSSVSRSAVLAELEATSYSLTVEAFVDGRSQLILKGDTAQWSHLEYAAPGRLGAGNEATQLGSLAWYPEWPDLPDRENRGCNCYSSMAHGVSPALPGQEMKLAALQVSGDGCLATVVQSPSPYNDSTLIVEFSHPPAGAAWCMVTINATSPLPANEPWSSSLTWEQCPYASCSTCTQQNRQVSWDYPSNDPGWLEAKFVPGAEKPGAAPRVFWDFEDFERSDSEATIREDGGSPFVTYRDAQGAYQPRLGTYATKPQTSYILKSSPAGTCPCSSISPVPPFCIVNQDCFKEARVWWYEACDATPPRFTPLGETPELLVVNGVAGGGAQITVQDSAAGLDRLYLDGINASPVAASFSHGTVDPVAVRFTERDGTSGGYRLRVQATDILQNTARKTYIVDIVGDAARRHKPAIALHEVGDDWAELKVQDTGSGLQRITVTSNACTVPPPEDFPFDRGTVYPVYVKATRCVPVNFDFRPAEITVHAWDVAGNDNEFTFRFVVYSQQYIPLVIADRSPR